MIIDFAYICKHPLYIVYYSKYKIYFNFNMVSKTPLHPLAKGSASQPMHSVTTQIREYDLDLD